MSTAVKFVIPAVPDNQDGWGPQSTSAVEKFAEMPYAPYSKSDRVGKAADWYSVSKYPQNTRYQSFGASAPFQYKYEEDDESFQLVDTRTVKPQYQRRKFNATFQRGGKTQGGRERNMQNMQRNYRGQQQGQREGGQFQRGGRQPFQRYGRFQDGGRQKQRVRDASVDIKPTWQVLEQIDFLPLTKLSVNPPEPEDLISAGSVEYYNRSVDKARVGKLEQALEKTERQFFKITTTDDPIIRELTMSNTGTVFATDAILSTLMTCPRSVYSFDIIIQRVGTKTFLDKRDNSQFDFLSVNETANEPPAEDKDPLNTPAQLSHEATFINQNYSQQVLLKDGKKVDFDKPNPFAEDTELASVGYRYRKWEIGNHTLVARTEVDAVLDDKGTDTYILCKALNEYDTKITDWRRKLDAQGGAVLATELKNNSNKLAKWTAQALLAGAEQINLGYVSRANVKDNYNHVILGTQNYKVKEFATQINLNGKNMWGILRHLFDIFAKLDNGKYIMVKDPNKQTMRIYSVPADAFDDLSQEQGGDDQKDSEAGDQ